MSYVKFKNDSKKRCAQIIERFQNDDQFQYLVENMIIETYEQAKEELVVLPVNSVHLQPTQGVARAFKELSTICQDPRRSAKGQYKK